MPDGRRHLSRSRSELSDSTKSSCTCSKSQQADLTRMLELTLSFEDLPIQLILQAYTAIAQVSRASAGLHRVYASMDNKAKNRTRATTTLTFVRSEAWFRHGEAALQCFRTVLMCLKCQPVIEGKKYACAACIKGHRTSACQHTVRQSLYRVVAPR